MSNTAKTVSRYRIMCNTDQKYVYVWSDTPPTVCPDNNAHLIDANTITIIDTISNSQVLIQHDTTGTFGRYRAEGKQISCAPGVTEHDFKWPYDINVFSVGIHCDQDTRGDILDSLISPHTIVGYTTAPIVIGDNTINLSTTASLYLAMGILVDVIDPSTGTSFDFGEITSNITNNVATCENISTVAFNPGCLIRLTLNNIRKYVLGQNGVISLGTVSSYSSTIPKNTTVRVRYQNNGTVTKLFNFYFQFYY